MISHPQALDSIWTLFFEHGWAAIVRTALVVLRVATPALLECDFEQCARLLTTEIWLFSDLDDKLRIAGEELAVTYDEVRLGQARVLERVARAEAAEEAVARGGGGGGKGKEAGGAAAVAPMSSLATTIRKGIDNVRVVCGVELRQRLDLVFDCDLTLNLTASLSPSRTVRGPRAQVKTEYESLDGEKKATVVAAAVGATFLTFGAAGLAIAALAASSALGKGGGGRGLKR